MSFDMTSPVSQFFDFIFQYSLNSKIKGHMYLYLNLELLLCDQIIFLLQYFAPSTLSFYFGFFFGRIPYPRT